MTIFSHYVRTALAGIGALAIALLVVGFMLDVQDFDPTSGGYEPPYTAFEGTPIDWTQTDVTADGMAKRGRIANVLINCTDGMISLEIFARSIPYRPLSERALAIHEPRAACEARGFSPAF